MKTFLFSILFLFSFSIWANKPPIKFGKISDEEINLQYYAHDSAAVALVLADFGHAYINIGTGRLIFERHKRIKILKKEGLSWADAFIPLYKQGTTKENVSNLKGATYNMVEGKMVETKMSKSSIFEETFNKNIILYKFALEDVKVGSIIEYSYKVHSEFFFNYPSWEFQSSIPTLWSEYRADIPEFFIYEKFLQGYVIPSINETNRVNNAGLSYDAHRWVAEEVPGFKKEPFMTSEKDYISKINFALSHYKLSGIVHDVMGSWEKLRENLWKSSYFGDIINGSGFLNKTVKDLTLDKEENLEKMRVIYDYIKNNIEWNGFSEFDSYGIKDAFKEGKGSSADINLALASMLKEAGLDVDMVILSTRDHGFVREQYSMAKQFNYVICAVYIDGKMLLLDGTDRLLPLEMLPERCLNGRGLLISKTKPIEWIPLESAFKSKTTVDVKLAIEEDGEMNGEIGLVKNKYDACKTRRSIKSKGEEEYLKELVANKSWKILSSEFTALDKVSEPLKEVYKVEISNHAMVAGNLVYINPILIDNIDSNPFKSVRREYPVDFGSPFDRTYVTQIELSDNLEIEYLPESKGIALPGNAGRYILNYVKNGNIIFVSSSFSINKSLFVQEEYLNLREFYSQIVALQSEQIVLKKTN